MNLGLVPGILYHIPPPIFPRLELYKRQLVDASVARPESTFPLDDFQPPFVRSSPSRPQIRPAHLSQPTHFPRMQPSPPFAGWPLVPSSYSATSARRRNEVIVSATRAASRFTLSFEHKASQLLAFIEATRKTHSSSISSRPRSSPFRTDANATD